MGDTTKKLLVIGAGRGLGLAIAAEYLNRGWRVVATEITHSNALHTLSDASEGKLEIESVDVTSPNQVAPLRSRLGDQRFDLFFHNAGVSNPEHETVAEVSTMDGTHSAVRRMCFGDESSGLLFLQNYFSLTIVNKLLIEENTSQMLSVPGKTVMLNAYNGKTDIAFCFSSEKLIDYDRRKQAEQKRMIREQFEGKAGEHPNCWTR